MTDLSYLVLPSLFFSLSLSLPSLPPCLPHSIVSFPFDFFVSLSLTHFPSFPLSIYSPFTFFHPSVCPSICPFFCLFKKKLYGPFLWMGFNCVKARATSRRQFTYSLLSLPSSIPPSLHPFLPPSIHPSIQPSLHPSIHPFIQKANCGSLRWQEVDMASLQWQQAKKEITYFSFSMSMPYRLSIRSVEIVGGIPFLVQYMKFLAVYCYTLISILCGSLPFSWVCADILIKSCFLSHPFLSS